MPVIRGRCSDASWADTAKADVSAMAAVIQTKAWTLAVSLKRIASPFSIPDFSKQHFNLRFFCCSDWQQRRTCAASVVAVKVAGMFDARNAQLANDALAGAKDAFLFFFCELEVVVLPCKIDLMAGLGSTGGKAQNGSCCTRLQRFQQRSGRTGKHLEADFLGSCFNRCSR